MVIDFWKITVRAGANSLAASCNILAGTSSGPVDLFVFKTTRPSSLPLHADWLVGWKQGFYRSSLNSSNPS